MRRSWSLLAAVLLLVVSAGCFSPVVDRAPSASPSPGGATPDAGVPTGDADATPTETDRETADAESGTNPWGDDPIVVAIERDVDADRPIAPLVRAAADYWERHDERYLGFPVEFAVRPNASDPDLIVRVGSEVPRCGVSDPVGCAPLVDDSRQIDRPERVWIRGGFSDESTTKVIRHELGHALGLTHADSPAEVMAERAVLHTQPQPNATERDFPWADPEFTVYVDDAGATDPDGAREQVDRALIYYESGPRGAPSNLSFRYVESPENADIVVRFVAESPCRDSAGSCGSTRGIDPDGDGAIERYTRLEIVLVDLETEAVGWHVGNWIATGLGADNGGEKPEPFRDASHAERRGEWWN